MRESTLVDHLVMSPRQYRTAEHIRQNFVGSGKNSNNFKHILTHFSQETPTRVIGKQYRPRSDTREHTVLQHLIRVFTVCFKYKNFYNIMLLNGCFHIGPVTGPRAIVLAWGRAEGQYSHPKANMTARGPVTNILFMTLLLINFFFFSQSRKLKVTK